MTEMLNGALRWVFWGILYLAIGMFALVMFLGYLAPYAAAPVRWAMLGIFLWGIALDVQSKVRHQKPGGRPPQDGDLTPVESRSS